MGQMTYINFDVQVERVARNRYRALVLESPSGQAEHEFRWPFNPLQLENFYLHLGQARQGLRDVHHRADPVKIERTRDFGGRLFASLFGPGVYACYRSSLDRAREQGMGLRIRLRLNASELSSLPWEFLYDPNVNMFLSRSIDTPIVRYIELPYKEPVLSLAPPLNMLVMISNPLGNLDVENEWQLLSQALAPLQANGLLKVERLAGASFSTLQRRLRQEAVHIFHFIGHGDFSEADQGGGLLLESESGQPVVLRGEQLGPVLHNHHALRLVVLNACDGARASMKDSFSGVAQRLVQMGIPVVIAMQFPVLDKSAMLFAQELYGALADGFPVDAALVEARTALSALPNDLEWGTPVMFTRAGDGRIFNVQLPETPVAAFPVQDDPEDQAHTASTALSAGDPDPLSPAHTVGERAGGSTAEAGPPDRGKVLPGPEQPAPGAQPAAGAAPLPARASQEMARPVMPGAGSEGGVSKLPLTGILDPPAQKPLARTPILWVGVGGAALLGLAVISLVVIVLIGARSGMNAAGERTATIASTTTPLQTLVRNQLTRPANLPATQNAAVLLVTPTEAAKVRIIQTRTETAATQPPTPARPSATASARPAAEPTVEPAGAAIHAFLQTLGITGTPRLIFEPAGGEIKHGEQDKDSSVAPARTSTKDFLAEVTFENPYATSFLPWSYSIGFRKSANNYYELVLYSNRRWSLHLISEGISSRVIASGMTRVIDTSEDGENSIRVVASDVLGWLYINNEFIARLDLSGLRNTGDIYLGIDFGNTRVRSGESTAYRNFTIWDLP